MLFRILSLILFLFAWKGYSQGILQAKQQKFLDTLLAIRSYEKALDNNHLYWEMYQDFLVEGQKIMENLYENPETSPQTLNYISYRLYRDYLREKNKKKLQDLQNHILLFYQKATDEQKKQLFSMLLIRVNILAGMDTIGDKRSIVEEKEALEFLRAEILRLGQTIWLVNYYIEEAVLYRRVSNYSSAVLMQGKALQVLDSLQSKDYTRYAEIEYALGYSHYETKNYQKAIFHWKKALKISKKHQVISRNRTLCNNNIGIAFRSLGQYDSAMVYLQETRKEAIALRDTIWIGISEGNMGDIWVLRKEYAKAIPLLERDIDISIRFQEQNNAVSSLSQLAFCYTKLQQKEKALENYQKALELYQAYEYLMIENEGISRFDRLLPIYEGLSKIYEAKQDYQKAYDYQNKAKTLQDTLKKRDFSEQINTLEEKYLSDIQEKEKKLLKASVQSEKIQKWLAVSVGVLLIFLLFGGFFFFSFKVQKAKLKAEKVAAEKQVEIEKSLRLEEEMRAEAEINSLKRQQYEEDIALKERELTTVTLLIHQKNEILRQLQVELSQVSQKTENEEIKQDLKQTLHNIKNDLHLENDWEIFKQQFEQVHPKFFSYLPAQYPDLNLTDLRICAYLRMNLDNKTIAQFLNISTDSLRVTRHRLRKKMNLATDKELYQVLSAII
ncbi:MAG: tetratricopeptide repeat protein [Thermonemataceae bacterium]|nr:tetratricopeptide repeat protein [Thermonemataceae bacterium]